MLICVLHQCKKKFLGFSSFYVLIDEDPTLKSHSTPPLKYLRFRHAWSII